MPKINVIILILISISIFNQNLTAHNVRRLIDTYSTAKADSITGIANPVPDQEMGLNDTIYIDINDQFSFLGGFYDYYYNVPEISNSSVVKAEIDQDPETYDIYLTLITYGNYGHSFVSISIESDYGSASDTFMVRVDDPEYEWHEGGSAYSFDPSNCIGSPFFWKAAQKFELGTDDYKVKQIEFAFSYDEVIEWSIVEFDQQPKDSIVIGGLSGTVSVDGGWPEFIDNTTDDIISDSIAVVLTSQDNYIPMDISAESRNTWIYTDIDEEYMWLRLQEVAEGLRGAWYIRLQLDNLTTGITEEFTSGIPDDCSLKNYPNPFNNETVISWELEKPSFVELNIYNSKGELVERLVNTRQFNRVGKTVFNSSGLNSGVYYYQLKVDGFVRSNNKMLYLK